MLDPLSPSETAAVSRAADRMGAFLERSVDVEWVGPREGGETG
jgi:hypothetical protein